MWSQGDLILLDGRAIHLVANMDGMGPQSHKTDQTGGPTGPDKSVNLNAGGDDAAARAGLSCCNTKTRQPSQCFIPRSAPNRHFNASIGAARVTAYEETMKKVCVLHTKYAEECCVSSFCL
jgi:hypothetical protein